VDRSDIDQIFMAINTVTKEIFLFYPSITTTKCIRYDYRNDTISVSDMTARAAAMIRRPDDDEEWFVMGNADGTITRYGLVDDDNIAITASQTGTTVSAAANTFKKEHVGRTIKWGDGTHVAVIEFVDDEEVIVDTTSEQSSQAATILPGVWHRLGSGYDSTLESGLDHFRGEGWDQVLLERYAPRFGIFSPCNVTLVGTKTSNGDPTDVKTKAISAENQTMMTTIMTRFYWGDRLSVSGKNNPCSVIGRNFRTKVIDAKGFRT
jgi:hypothetical protein